MTVGSASSRTARAPWWPWVLCAAVVAGALTVGMTRERPPATDTERVAAIARTIKCPKCTSESVDQSAVQISREIRIDIAKRIQQGQSDEQIQNAYRDQYGEQILLTPAASGLSAAVWAVPVVALVIALAGLAATFRRWRRAEDADVAHGVSEADRRLVDEALAAESARTDPDGGLDDGEPDGGNPGPMP